MVSSFTWSFSICNISTCIKNSMAIIGWINTRSCRSQILVGMVRFNWALFGEILQSLIRWVSALIGWRAQNAILIGAFHHEVRMLMHVFVSLSSLSVKVVCCVPHLLGFWRLSNLCLRVSVISYSLAFYRLRTSHLSVPWRLGWSHCIWASSILYGSSSFLCQISIFGFNLTSWRIRSSLINIDAVEGTSLIKSLSWRNCNVSKITWWYISSRARRFKSWTPIWSLIFSSKCPCLNWMKLR